MTKRRGAGLVNLLAAIVIIALLAGAFVYGPNLFKTQDEDGPQTIPGMAMQAGNLSDCQQRLPQIRSAIEMRRILDDPLPDTLEGLGLGASFVQCEVPGYEFVYDPSTGQVELVAQ